MSSLNRANIRTPGSSPTDEPPYPQLPTVTPEAIEAYRASLAAAMEETYCLHPGRAAMTHPAATPEPHKHRKKSISEWIHQNHTLSTDAPELS